MSQNGEAENRGRERQAKSRRQMADRVVVNTSRREALIAANEPLYTTCLFKEALRMFRSMEDKATAELMLENWLQEARASGLKHFAKLAETPDKNRQGFLFYFWPRG